MGRGGRKGKEGKEERKVRGGSRKRGVVSSNFQNVVVSLGFDIVLLVLMFSHCAIKAEAACSIVSSCYALCDGADVANSHDCVVMSIFSVPSV